MQIYKFKYTYPFGNTMLEAEEYVLENDITNALITVVHYLSQKYKVFDVVYLEALSISIINMPEVECDCPFCQFNDADKDKRISFEHDCGNLINVADGGWTTLQCPFCGKDFFRSNIEKNGESWSYDEKQ